MTNQNNTKELLFSVTKKDFIIEPYKGSGKGGQHRNKTMSCCRIKHPESGAVAQACEDRDFHRNRKVAFRRLVNSDKFQNWRKRVASDILHNKKETEKLVDKLVEESMIPDNIRVETLINGKWETENLL